MSANSNSGGFKLACDAHVLAYFEKIYQFLEKSYFLQTKPYGLGQIIFYIKFLVVSDKEALFKWCKRSGYSGSIWIAFKWGFNMGVYTTAIYEK